MVINSPLQKPSVILSKVISPVLTEKTKANRNEIDHCIRWLKSAKQIATQKATRGFTIFILNYEQFQDKNSYKSDTESDAKSDIKATQKRHRSDTIPNKDNKDKNKEDKSSLSPKHLTDLQKLVETYTTLFKQRFKEEAVVSNWGKIGKLFQSPLKTYGLEKLRGWLETYIFSDDEFIKKSGWRLEIFPSQINKMITDGRKKSWM